MQILTDDNVSIGRLSLSRRDYQELQRLRKEAFTPWLEAYPPRIIFNLAARVFDGFLLEARLRDHDIAGYLFSVPAFWSGDPSELQTYDHYRKNLFRRPVTGIAATMCAGPLRIFESPLRQAHLKGTNSIVLLAMLVREEYRGLRIPLRFIEHLKGVATKMGYRWLLGPFRPSGYGRYKERTHKPHTAELFRDYCYDTGPDNLPIDPWLRTLVQNGMKMLRPEPRSMQVTRDLRAFDRLRKKYRSNHWYRTSENAWECGETPTWYTDFSTRTATLVEPNLWGVISVQS